MATYEETSFKARPWYHPTAGEHLAFRSPARTYAEDDVVKFFKLERAIKIADAVVANAELDSNVTPTATGILRLNNGTAQVDLVDVAAATLGVVDGVTRLNNLAGLGFITPARGYWLEFVFTAAFATAAEGVLAVSLAVSALTYGSESPVYPTGS